MVSKYDVFEIVYEYRHPIKPIEVVEKLKKGKEEYDNIHRLLINLKNEGFVVKTNYGFQAKRNDKTKILYDIIYHCLRNNINYNDLLHPSMAQFLSRALQNKEINSKNSKINHQTLKKYVEILNNNGLLLVISYKPLRVKVFYNTLLNNILVYFGYKHSVLTSDVKDYGEIIKKELVIFKKKKNKNPAKYKNIVNEFEISFVHHSLSLEGNPITLQQTKNILQQKVIPANLRDEDVDEVKNYQQAMLKMLEDSQEKNPLTTETILDYHALAMQHRPEIAGKIRKIEVHIKGNPNFKITMAKNIESELTKLMEEYNEFTLKKKHIFKDILSFASYFHNQFQHIHPFEDGNSRTTRLLTFHLLQLQNIPILDIPFGLLDEYLSYTKGSKKREDTSLYQTLQKIILHNLKKINGMLG